MSTTNTHNVQTTSSAAASSSTLSVRPRPKRLISGLSDTEEPDVAPSPAPGPSPSPFDSRSASPIPSAHPQRSNSRNPNDKFTGTSWGRRAQVAAQRNGPAPSPTSPSFAGLWGTSWSTLQGIASDILGNEATAENAGAVKDGKKSALPKWYRQMTLAPREGSTQNSAWGPTPTSTAASASIGAGTKADRESAVRAQKRKDMLLREDSTYAADALGKFKRRLSDDMESRSAPPSDSDERSASLVYLHHVQRDDTMAGVSIKYNCSANILRKANRLWSNDTPQARKVLVIPVAQCGIKGRPIDSGSLDTISSSDDASTSKAPHMNGDYNTDPRRDSQTSSSAAATDQDPPWQHDSWVQLPNFPQPTEIARLSRSALGYFPPARRKSLDQKTPSASLDLQRVSTSDARQDSRSPQRPRRGRRLSNANSGYFPSYLAGPGGVGTMNKNVRTPGPAQDGLNKMFAKHLPDVAPPRNQTDLYQPELPLYTDETPVSSGVVTPSGKNANMNINLENVGGAIENWARRMVTKAMTPTEAQTKSRAARASVGTAGKGAGGIGDLIEMTDEFEIGGDDDDDMDPEPSRGRQFAAVNTRADRTDFGQLSGSGADYFGDNVIGARERASGTSNGKGRKVD